MSIRWLLFQWASTIKIQLFVLVSDKGDLIIFSLKIHLFLPWYSWKIAELVLNNKHSLVKLRVWIQWSVLNTTLHDKVCQWLVLDQRFNLGTTVSSTNKTDFHDITELFLKVALNSITRPLQGKHYDPILCTLIYLWQLIFGPLPDPSASFVPTCFIVWTGATCETGTTNSSGAPEFTPVFSWVHVARSLNFYIMFCGHCVVWLLV
jgi:hypothetical protein